jgi:DNA repair protein RadD
MQLRWYQNEANDRVLAYLFETAGRGYPCNPLVVLPTGSGKSLVINDLIYRVLSMYPTQKIVVSTHVKELIEQSYTEMFEHWPYAPAGVCSAGLGVYDTQSQIVYGGVKTLLNRVEALGLVHILIVDECHLIDDKASTTYQKLIALLRARNPHLVVIGYTATDFRLGMGKLTDGDLFTHVVYDMSTPEAFSRLFAEGFLVPPVAKLTTNYIDTDGVAVVGGEFNRAQLEAKSTDKLLYDCLAEACAMGQNRRSWLAFCSGVESAQTSAKILRSFGVSCEAVYDGLGKKLRKEYIDAFKNFELRALTNNNILTTGFNHPALDFIIGLRATTSPSLWVQMLGRGTRPYAVGMKRNCYVADFSRNAERLGTIDDPKVPRKKKGGGGDMPIWLCPNCGTKNHARAPVCIDCGMLHVFETKLTDEASVAPLVSSDSPELELFTVEQVIYLPHHPKPDETGKIKASSLRVTYYAKPSSGRTRKFDEWVFPAHDKKFLVHRFHNWWKQRHLVDPPTNLYDVQFYIDQLRTPKQIKVWTNKKPFPEIMGATF